MLLDIFDRPFVSFSRFTYVSFIMNYSCPKALLSIDDHHLDIQMYFGHILDFNSTSPCQIDGIFVILIWAK